MKVCDLVLVQVVLRVELELAHLAVKHTGMKLVKARDSNEKYARKLKTTS